MGTYDCRCGHTFNLGVSEKCPDCHRPWYADYRGVGTLIADGGIELQIPRRQHDPDYSWRFACPECHRSVERRQSGGYYCNSCNERYHGDPRDLANDGGST